MATITIFGSGRLGPTAVALLGLAATVLSVRALRAARRAGTRRPELRPSTSLALGVVALVLGGVFLAAADGGPGEGDGVVGSVAGIVLGLAAIGIHSVARRATPAAGGPRRG